MAVPAWQLQGQYYETCNCDFVCPCVPAQLAVMPTKGPCIFAMAFQVEKGRYGSLPLDGLGFIVVGSTPAEMGKGNWSVGLIVDERASSEQRDAIAGIACGAAGGPMAALSGLISTMLGVESSPIQFSRDGVSWSVNASTLVRMAAQGATGLNPAAPPLELAHTGHPAADTFSLARASSSHVSALGISWDDISGRNNGQYAPFNWQNA
jgi:hypothetical protein